MSNNQTRPNLFSYATSELSQDAFICWLAAWADPTFANSELHQIARKFLILLIHKHKQDYSPEKIQTVKVRRQVEKLDVLIEVNRENDKEKLAILIEDKTHTDHHSGQLDRYYRNMLKEYAEEQIIPIYFKTGYQSKFNVGYYKTYLREEFLSFLREGSESTKNAIYTDFFAHLENIEFVVNQYWTKNLLVEDAKAGWDENDWRGFFIHLYKNRSQLYNVTDDDTANWSYIANPSGGFFGFWWYFKELAGEFYTPYLQLENNSLCFKIKVEDELKRSQAREEAYYKLKEVNIEIDRPRRMGNGLYMTVAKWPKDYRESKDGKLDFNGTLINLKKAQQILDTAFPQ
jgi:hypothetical protein